MSGTKFSEICPYCNQRIHNCTPMGGDGSVAVFIAHVNKQGDRCQGSRAIIPSDWKRLNESQETIDPPRK